MTESASLTPPVSGRDHVQGRPEAAVTLVEYGDYQCPYCGAAHAVIKALQRDLGRNLRLVFRNFPLTQAHAYAMVAAEAAEAAAFQGRFWEMHDFIYEHQDDLEPDVLPAWAEQVGLDLDEFGIALRQAAITTRIKEDRMSGIRSGVNGAPCFFVNGTRHDGAADYDLLRAALEEQLMKQIT
jgi:protein-disulfide isomerase